MVDIVEFMIMEMLVSVTGSMLTSVLLGVDKNRKKSFAVFIAFFLKIVVFNVAVDIYKKVTGDSTSYASLWAAINIISLFIVIFYFQFISGCSLLHCIYGGMIFVEAILGAVVMLCSFVSHLVSNHIPSWKGLVIVVIFDVLLAIAWYYLLHVPRLYQFLSKFPSYKFKFKWIWAGVFLLMVGNSFSAYISSLKVPIHQAVEQTAYVLVSLFMICELYWMFYVMKERRVRHDYHILMKENMVMKEYYDTLSHQMSLTRRFRHDIVKHMNVIEELGNIYQSDQMIKDYISHFEDQYHELEQIAYSGELVVDAILLNKKRQCEELGIDLQIEMKSFEAGKMRDIDITALLANLIDNAVTVCLKIEDVTQRKIWIKSGRQGENQFLQIKNRYNPAYIKEMKQLKASKKDRDAYGVGTEIIEQIIEKYDGNISFEINDNQQMIVVLAQWS